MKVIRTNTSRKAFIALMQQLKTTINGRNIVIAPDRFAVSVTKAIFSVLGVTTTSNVEVIPFSKLGEKFIPKEIKKCLSPNGAVMLLSKVLINLNNNKELKHYNGVSNKEGFASELYAAITSFRNSGINPIDLKEGIKELPINLKVKTEDLYLIYNAYLEALSKSNDDSTTILEKLESYFENHKEEISTINFYITDIYDFTKKELDILHVLAKNALSLTIAIPYSFGGPNSHIYPDRVIDKIVGKIGGECEIVDEIEAISNTKEIISKYLFSYCYPKDKVEADGVYIKNARDKYNEVLSLALDIVKGVRDKRKYKDFEVYIPNLDEYCGEIESIFNRYKIPFFIDKKSSLIEQAKTRYILAAIKCAKSDLARQDVLDFVKNPLFYLENNHISQNDIFEFENYVLAYNIDHSIFRNDFEYYDKKHKVTKSYSKQVISESGEVTSVENGESLVFNNYTPNLVRQELIKKLSPILDLDLSNVKMDIIVDACREILSKADNSWKKHVKDLSNISAYYVKCSDQVDKKLKEVLDEMETVLDIDTNIIEFYTVFKSAVENVEIALVPTYLDSVFIGGLESGFIGDGDIYILGATNTDIPMVPSGGSIITKMDKETLSSKAKLVIDPNEKQQLFLNMYKVCDIMKKPMGKLIISYPESTSSSNTRPSIIISDLKKMFKDLNEKKIDFSNLTESCDYKEVAKYLFATKEACVHEVLKNNISGIATGKEKALYEAASEFIKDKLEDYEGLFVDPIVIDLDGANVFMKSTSVSRIESFYRCPYQYYLRYMLNLKIRKDDKFEGTENGTIIHSILEQFMRDIKAGVEFKEEDIKEAAYRYFDKAIDEEGFDRLMLKNENRRVLLRVKEEGVKILEKMYGIIKRSQFGPFLIEGSIGGENEEIKPLTLQSGTVKTELTGYIDRADVLGDDFYIIDYKTYKSADLSLKELYKGTKIQPLIYMRAIEKDKQLNPVGVFYLPIYSTFTDENENTLQLKGLASNDRDVLISMDSLIATDPNAAFLVPKEGKTSLDPSKHLDKKHFDLLGDYAEEIATLAIKDISEGFIKPTPLESTTCQYCSYSDVCEFASKSKRSNLAVSMDIFEKDEEKDETIEEVKDEH